MNIELIHADHGLTDAHLTFLGEALAGQADGFFLATFDMPEGLTLPLGLYGPTVGDAPVPEGEVTYQARNGRDWADRLVTRPMRTSTVVTAIGIRDGESVKLFTAHGGPAAAQNPADPSCADKDAAKAFWATHALVNEG